MMCDVAQLLDKQIELRNCSGSDDCVYLPRQTDGTVSRHK